MANRSHANSLFAVGQLIEDPVGADSQRVKTAEFAAKSVACSWVTLKQAEGILYRIDQGPVETEQLTTGTAGENKFGQ